MKTLKLKETLPNEGITVAKFFATWCGPCKRMDLVVEKLETEFNQFTFVAVDVDEFPEIASTYGVKALPTVVFLKDGKEVQRVIGASLIDPLRKILRDITE